MRKSLLLTFISRLILFVLLTTMISSVYGTEFTMECHAAGTKPPASYSDVSPQHECPCSPDEQHGDHDGCVQCVNCACHAPLTSQPILLVYNPVIATLRALTPLAILPEVFLSLFVPPDSTTI